MAKEKKPTKPREKRLPFGVTHPEWLAIRESCPAQLMKSMAPAQLQPGDHVAFSLTREQAAAVAAELPTEGPLHWLRYRILAAVALYDEEAPKVDVEALQRTMVEMAGDLGALLADYRRAPTPELKAKIDTVINEKQLNEVMVYGGSAAPDLAPAEPEPEAVHETPTGDLF